MGRRDYTFTMASRPLITVAVAMFQSEDTIEACLRSVFDQHPESVEVVIVDDGSTDSSATKALAIDSEGIPVRIISHESNQGLGPARNTAVKAAHGDYIVFLDSDDELLPGSLEAIARVVEKSEADLLLTGSVERKRGKDRPMNSGPLLHTLAGSGEYWDVWSHPELFFWIPSTWAKVYRREFLIDNDIVFPPGYHQDIPSTVDALLMAKTVSAVDYPCYLYIRRGEGSSATQSKGTKTLVRIEQIQRIRARHDVSKIAEPVRSHLVALVAIHLIWANRAAYRTMPEELHEQFYRDSSEELQWWWQHSSPGREINSDALLPTDERVMFQQALLHGDYTDWQNTLARHQKALKRRRLFDLSRYRLFK